MIVGNVLATSHNFIPMNHFHEEQKSNWQVKLQRAIALANNSQLTIMG